MVIETCVDRPTAMITMTVISVAMGDAGIIDHDEMIDPTTVDPTYGNPTIGVPSNATRREPNLDVTPNRGTIETPEAPEIKETTETTAGVVRETKPRGRTAAITGTTEASVTTSETDVTTVRSREAGMNRHTRRIAATIVHRKKNATLVTNIAKTVMNLRKTERQFAVDL